MNGYFARFLAWGYLFCLVNYLLVWPKMSQVSIMGLKYLLEQYNYFTFSMFCDIQQVEDLWKKYLLSAICL